MRFLQLVLVLFSSGCATVAVDGFTLTQNVWTNDQIDIRSRASFELSCPAESLTLQVLATSRVQSVYAGQVGVTGCEKRVVYVRSEALGWVANSSSQSTGR